MTNRFSWRAGRSLLTVGAALAALAGGCSQYIDPAVPEPIRPLQEPERGGEYLLYRPANYDRNQAWPLIVVCHGGFGGSPNKQIRNWTEAAESRGFLVVAPQLESAAGGLLGGGRSIEEMRADREHILKTVRHVRAGHTISRDRIFIYGWGGGAPAALFTGLSHPEIFRAIVVAQPRIEPGNLADVASLMHRYQPVAVMYSSDDSARGGDADELVAWLHEHGADVRQDKGGRFRPSDTNRALNFIEALIRDEPWAVIRVAAVGVAQPLAYRFGLDASFEPAQFRWDFGDGSEPAVVAEPIHTYREPGVYRVVVIVDHPLGGTLRRARTLEVP